VGLIKLLKRQVLCGFRVWCVG